MNIVRIIPSDRPYDGAHTVQGTKVVLPDGSYIDGVFKVVLTAHVADVWKAEIHCYVQVDEIIAEATIVEHQRG